MSGERDPVGPNLESLVEAFRAAGFSRLQVRIYPDARHEILNETNRDEVTRDLIAWLDGAIGARPPWSEAGCFRAGLIHLSAEGFHHATGRDAPGLRQGGRGDLRSFAGAARLGL